MKNFGFTMIELLMSVAMVSVAWLGGSSLMTSVLGEQERVRLQSEIYTIRNNIFLAFNDPRAWIYTIKSNPGPGVPNSMNCLLALVDSSLVEGAPLERCAPYIARPLILKGRRYRNYDANDPDAFDIKNTTTVFDSTNPKNGFTSKGTPCNTFEIDPNIGNDRCPIGVKMEWVAMCDENDKYSCNIPQLDLILKFYYHPESRGNRLRTAKYDIRYTQNKFTLSLNKRIEFCGRNGKIYMPYGYTNPINGLGFLPDANTGCITPEIWMLKGVIGPAGLRGDRGPTGSGCISKPPQGVVNLQAVAYALGELSDAAKAVIGSGGNNAQVVQSIVNASVAWKFRSTNPVPAVGQLIEIGLATAAVDAAVIAINAISTQPALNIYTAMQTMSDDAFTAAGL